MGFDVPENKLVTVSYKELPLKIEIDPETGKPKPFMKRLRRRKFIDWEYEEEMRLFVGLDHGTVESGKYFYPFSDDLMLREIILGPLCELPIEGVRKIAADFKPPAFVFKSRIAYTRYAVLKYKVAPRTITKR